MPINRKQFIALAAGSAGALSLGQRFVTQQTSMPKPEAQEEWKEKTLSYVRAFNAYRERGYAEGWENVGEAPKDPGRGHLAWDAIAALRSANLAGYTEDFRKLWPPAHAPLIPILEENGQNIPVVCLLNDGSLVVRIGANYEPGRTIWIQGDRVTDMPEVGYFGRCPNRRYFGVAQETGIAILDGWQGPQVALCPWPNGTEDIPSGFKVAPWDNVPSPSRIVPFPDGKRVLMTSERGIFVLSERSARRLVPTQEQLRVDFEWSLRKYPGEDPSVHL